MNIISKVKGNLSRFVPGALRKRYGRANVDASLRPGTRALVLDADGAELLARIVEDLGGHVRVEFDDGSIEEVDRADLRRVPRRRRAPSAEVAREASAEHEPDDAE